MLKGFVYDYTGERNADQFIKTTEQLKIYVGCMYTKYTTDFLDTVDDLYLDGPKPPIRPEDKSDVFEMEDFKEEKKEYRVKSRKNSNFKSGFHTVIYGQCTESLKDKLKSHADFEEMRHDGIALLRMIIKVIMYSFKQTSHQEDELRMTLKKAFYGFRQGNNMTLQHYYDLFIGQSKVLEEVGATITDFTTAVKIANENGNDFPMDEDLAEARKQALAMCFIQGANAKYSAEYLVHLHNSSLQGSNYYPKMLTEAYHTLSRH